MMCQVCPRGEEEYIQGLRIMKEHFVRRNGREFSITGASHGEVRMEPGQEQGQGVVVGPEEGWRGGWSSDRHRGVFLLTPCVTGRQGVLLAPHCYFPITRYPPTFEVHAVGFTTVVSLKTAAPGSPSTSPPPLLHFEGFQNPGSFFIRLTYRHLFPPSSSFAYFCGHELFITAPPSKS